MSLLIPLMRTKKRGVIYPNVAFNWFPYKIYNDYDSTFSTNFDIAVVEPAGTDYYVATDGNDGAAGTSGAPLRAVKTAVGKTGAVNVFVKPGIYGRTYGLDGTTISKNVSIKKWPGESGQVVITNHQDGLSWTLDDTATYYTTRSGVARVIDVNGITGTDYETAEVLTLRADVAGVKANPGSWYLDGSNVLWVQTSDSRAVDDNVWPLIGNNIRLSADIDFYTEGITYIGGGNGTGVLWYRNSAGSQTPVVAAKDCSFLWGTSNGVFIEGAHRAYFDTCICAKGIADGFNYQDYNSDPTYAFEINCTGRSNGAAGDNDNGSGMHGAGSIIRVYNGTGLYTANIGPNVIDIDTSTSWNLGIISSESAATGGSSDPINFASNSSMWLDTCTSSYAGQGASDYDLGGSGTIYTHSLTSGGNNVGGLTVTPY